MYNRSTECQIHRDNSRNLSARRFPRHEDMKAGYNCGFEEPERAHGPTTCINIRLMIRISMILIDIFYSSVNLYDNLITSNTRSCCADWSPNRALRPHEVILVFSIGRPMDAKLERYNYITSSKKKGPNNWGFP